MYSGKSGFMHVSRVCVCVCVSMSSLLDQTMLSDSLRVDRNHPNPSTESVSVFTCVCLCIYNTIHTKGEQEVKEKRKGR